MHSTPSKQAYKTTLHKQDYTLPTMSTPFSKIQHNQPLTKRRGDNDYKDKAKSSNSEMNDYLTHA
jgi:hypothetical protein